MLIDSHCHLDMLDQTKLGIPEYLAQAEQQDVGFFLNVCVALSQFDRVLSIAKQYPHVAATVGLHPNELESEASAELLIKYAKDPKIVAIGETGLDYYRSSGDLTWQQNRFRYHIDAAKHLKKPIIVHTRNAKTDTIKIMLEEAAHSVGGVMHCFTEDWEMAKKALDLGFYISFSGIVTFTNAREIQSVAKQVPLDRILIETDAPYLAPVPFRGKPNEPAYVRYTANFLAKLREIDLEVFAEATTENFFRLFKEAERPHV